MTASNNTTTWTYSTGIVLDTERGERPKETAKKLLETRAIQVIDGWVGQILMAGEIVHETAPKIESDDAELDAPEQALEEVNQRILAAFRRLIVGV